MNVKHLVLNIFLDKKLDPSLSKIFHCLLNTDDNTVHLFSIILCMYLI